jgi:hypothetical protein
MDSLGLFTHGQFLDYDNPDPELLLYSHGEFPRPSAVVVVAKSPGASATRVGGSTPRRKPDTDLEDWAIVLLLLDE